MPGSLAGHLVRFWEVSLKHEQAARGEAHLVRLMYGGKMPRDGTDFLMISHWVGLTGGYTYKVPDTAYTQLAPADIGAMLRNAE